MIESSNRTLPYNLALNSWSFLSLIGRLMSRDMRMVCHWWKRAEVITAPGCLRWTRWGTAAGSSWSSSGAARHQHCVVCLQNKKEVTPLAKSFPRAIFFGAFKKNPLLQSFLGAT